MGHSVTGGGFGYFAASRPATRAWGGRGVCKRHGGTERAGFVFEAQAQAQAQAGKRKGRRRGQRDWVYRRGVTGVVLLG